MNSEKTLQKAWQDYTNIVFDNGTTPRQWVEAGFTNPRIALSWMNDANSFDPESTKKLIDKGFDPDNLARIITEKETEDNGLLYFGETVAYMYCNGDIDMDTVYHLAEM